MAGAWAPLDTPVVPLNFCREPKDVPLDIHSTYMKFMTVQVSSLEKGLNFEP